MDDEEPLAEVFGQPSFALDAIVNDAPAMTPHDTSIHERPTLPEAPSRDTVVDAVPSFFERAYTWLASMISTAMKWPRLSDHLPPVPIRSAYEVTRFSPEILAPEERAEAMLLEIMRAPPEYVDAAILIARATIALRKEGDDVFAEGFVTFALSRMQADEDGTVPIKCLREQLRGMPVPRSFVPVLLRLEEQGVVEMLSEDASASSVVDMDRSRVRLLVLP